MCGIAGLIDAKRHSDADRLRAIASRMADSLRHRGPDDRGVWIDAQAGVALGHTRLAIIDLSPAGAQPMVSSCGRFVLSYNGEVYNAPELRAELEAAGRPFRGHSDTEVMVEGFAVWGVRPTVERLIGMFAFAAWDRSTHTLTLGARPPRHQAALLGPRRRQSRVRLGTEGAQDAPRLAGRDRPRRARGVPALRLCADADEHLSRDQQARARDPARMRRTTARITQTAYWSLSEVAERGQATPLDVSDAAARRRWNPCLPMRCAGAWSPTCRSACFCPAASTPRRSRR